MHAEFWSVPAIRRRACGRHWTILPSRRGPGLVLPGSTSPNFVPRSTLWRRRPCASWPSGPDVSRTRYPASLSSTATTPPPRARCESCPTPGRRGARHVRRQADSRQGDRPAVARLAVGARFRTPGETRRCRFRRQRGGSRRLVAALAAGDLGEVQALAERGHELEGGPRGSLTFAASFIASLRGSAQRDPYLRGAAAISDRVAFTGRLEHDGRNRPATVRGDGRAEHLPRGVRDGGR